ncbi:MAG: flagellin [Pseudobdellovibrionaceae bacterium]
MGLRINTNLASLAAQRQISLSQRQAEGTMKALASGNRFANRSESSADFSIAEHLRGQIAGIKSGKMNAENAQSFIQVAEGGLNEQNNLLIRMRELAVQAASDTFSDQEREFLNSEFEQLQQEVDRIALTTQFGSQKLLAGESREYDFHVGAYGGAENIIKYKSETNTRAGELGVDGLTVSDKSDARDSLESIDEALTKIASARSGFGAIDARLNSAVNSSGVMVENLEAARSRIADTDIAQAVSDFYRNQAMQQYQVSVLNEANRFPGSVIRLIG